MLFACGVKEKMGKKVRRWTEEEEVNRDELSNVKIGQDHHTRQGTIWLRDKASRYVLRVPWGHGFM